MSDRVDQILRARFIAPIARPIIENGAIAIRDGRITDVNRFDQLRDRNGPVTDLGDAVILPGLVNAHVHLELSSLTASEQPRGSFAKWLLARANASRGATVDPVAATKIGIAQCLKFGVTCVGDITQNHHATRSTLASSPLRGVSFGEALGVGNRRHRFDELMRTAPLSEGKNWISGISPHAPYSVDQAGYELCTRVARDSIVPIATHLAESSDERLFLESHAGPFRELLETLGSWRDDIETFRGSPIEMANAIGLLKLHNALLAHVNYCDDAELELLANGRASVVYCPRTHAYFNHPPHRWREMLERGINVAIGTDSCASSPDLNLVDDLRLLRKFTPDMPSETLWALATIKGARSLGIANEVGSIDVGKRADLIAFDVNRVRPLDEILDTNVTPQRVWMDGKQIADSEQTAG